MRNLVTLSDSIGGNLTGAGFALETIANLLGADGCEHFLNKDHINGLVHAVLTISVYVKDAGYDLCEGSRDCPGRGVPNEHSSPRADRRRRGGSCELWSGADSVARCSGGGYQA
ncbi:hypothetical protein ACPA9J_20250 [Pseudomonas aeruginosa]